MYESAVIEVPIGSIAITAKNGAIISLRFENPEKYGDGAGLKTAEREIREYFAGKRKKFTLPVEPEGTEYQKRVWKAVMAIPYGETRTYRWVADVAGGSPRSAGNALGANPIPIIIPCHRVLRKDGSIGGYSSGTEIKRYLLKLELENR